MKYIFTHAHKMSLSHLFDMIVEAFVDKLVENQKPSNPSKLKETFMGIWRDCNQSMHVHVDCPTDEKHDTVKKRKKTDIEKTAKGKTEKKGENGTCTFILPKGSAQRAKGSVCGKKAVSGKDMCSAHSKKMGETKRVLSEEKVAESAEDDDVDEEVVVPKNSGKGCIYTLSGGKCNCQVGDNELCKKHLELVNKHESTRLHHRSSSFVQTYRFNSETGKLDLVVVGKMVKKSDGEEVVVNLLPYDIPALNKWELKYDTPMDLFKFSDNDLKTLRDAFKSELEAYAEAFEQNSEDGKKIPQEYVEKCLTTAMEKAVLDEELIQIFADNGYDFTTFEKDLFRECLFLEYVGIHEDYPLDVETEGETE
jgi:hypothetical protein